MGPDISGFAGPIQQIGDMFRVNLEDMMDMKQGVYWIVLDVCIFFCSLNTFFFFFNNFVIKEVFPTSGLASVIKSASDTLLPIIGNLLFIPIISFQAEVFFCTQTLGDDIDDAFLHKDCY